MSCVYEVVEYYYDYPQNEVLYSEFEDAEKDLLSRVEKFKNRVRLVTDIKEINKAGYTDNIIVMDRHDTNPNELKMALILHYPEQCEVEGEPLWSDTIQINITRRELK